MFTNASVGRTDATSYSAPEVVDCQDRIKIIRRPGVLPQTIGCLQFWETEGEKLRKLEAINMRAKAVSAAVVIGLVLAPAERLWPESLCSVPAWLCRVPVWQG